MVGHSAQRMKHENAQKKNCPILRPALRPDFRPATKICRRNFGLGNVRRNKRVVLADAPLTPEMGVKVHLPRVILHLKRAKTYGSCTFVPKKGLKAHSPRPPFHKTALLLCSPHRDIALALLSSPHRDIALALVLAADFHSESTNRSGYVSHRKGGFLRCTSH